MRRVVVTPTFAAGLGVVIAAVLAYPMARTVFFRYNTPDGQPCQLKRCGVGAEGSVPSLASAKPGLPLTPARSASPAAQSPSAAGNSMSRQLGRTQPVMDYQTMHQQRATFVAELTVITSSRLPPGDWKLGFTYPSATILNVSGGTVVSQAPHSVVVEGSKAGPQGVHLMIEVTGQARPPASGVFNDRACRIVDDTPAGGGR